MRKYTLLSLIITAATTVLNAQNTIPTTTCTGAMKINDSLNVNKDITAFGDITSKGEMIATDTMRAMENVIANKDIKVEGSVFVNADVMVEGKVNTKGGLTFDGFKGLFYTPPSATQGSIFELGPKIPHSLLPTIQCPTPTSQPWNSFYYAGDFVSYLPTGSTTQYPLVNAAFRIGIAPWNGNALMDVSGVDAYGQGYNGLEINSFCKRNTYINTGWNIPQGIDGGTVFLGAKVDMQSSLKIGWTESGEIDLLTSIDINQNQNNSNGVRVNTWNNGIKAYSVLRNDGKNTFVVYGDGRAYFGVQRVKPSHPHTNSQYQFDGKIACKELVVVDPTKWADFVFEKSYNLLSLSEVEKYINQNKHLPSVPSEKEVKENGINTAEMDAILLQKIEELTLYILQQQKEIEALKKEIKK